MADRQPGAGPRAHRPASGQALLRRLQDRAPTSTQVVGFLTLVISGGILLLLTGLTLTGTVAGLVFFGPIILLTSPIWFPAAAVVFIAIAGFLSFCGFGVVVVAGATWLYRYFCGRHPVGSDRVDYARSRIADTASHMKDYAREYGGYLHSRVKDAAPGA